MTHESTPTQPVAIVGMSALFPEAEDLRAFWDNIVAGRDCIADVPPVTLEDRRLLRPRPDRARQDLLPAAVGSSPMSTSTRWSSASRRTSSRSPTSPSCCRCVLAKQAFADAGYGEGGRAFDRERTGVVLGVGGGQKLITPLTSRLQYPVWERALRDERRHRGGGATSCREDQAAAYVGWEENSFPGMLGNVVAGRIANRLDLGGTNCVVDAACATSLAALRMALDELPTAVPT